MTTFALLNFGEFLANNMDACNATHGGKDDIGPNLLDRGLIEYLFNMLQEGDESIRQSVVDTLAGLARYGEHDATVPTPWLTVVRNFPAGALEGRSS